LQRSVILKQQVRSPGPDQDDLEINGGDDRYSEFAFSGHGGLAGGSWRPRLHIQQLSLTILQPPGK
jgi:hypothetical protein